MTRRLIIGTLILLLINTLGAAVALARARYFASPRSQSHEAWFLADRLGIDLNQFRVEGSDVIATRLDVWWHADRLRAPTPVVVGGMSLRATPREYGENTFFLCYGEALLGRFGQFKTDRHHYHHYSISVTRGPSNTVQANVSAAGPDDTAFEPYREGSYSSLGARDEWTFQADHCKRSAAEPRVATVGAAARTFEKA